VKQKNIININEFLKRHGISNWIVLTSSMILDFECSKQSPTAKLFPIPENWQNPWLYNNLITKRLIARLS